MLARVGGDVGLAIKMKLAYHAQPDLQARMQAQSGLDAATMDYLTRAVRHGNLTAWARHLDPPALERLKHARTTACANGCASQARCAMRWRRAKASTAVGVQALVAEWESLLDEFSGGDAT